MVRLAVVGLGLLATILVGTVTVLSVVQSFFGVDWNDALTLVELQEASSTARVLPYDAAIKAPYTSIGQEDGLVYTHERIPRILHQTWKNETLPERWKGFSAQCREMHPDYEYMLWTDAKSREFIADHYPWFLPTFDGYPYNIQRADVIRYFVLHHYGGVYLDLDIGCRAPIDPLLLHTPAMLPVTKPVGISNDLMASESRGPFMDSVIHNLVAFDHTYLSAYPTVMFSTGPMFLSAVLSLWNSKDRSFLTDSTPGAPVHEPVRILPPSLYGKNLDPQDCPDSLFWHYYGSSWHAGDSGLFTFLGDFGSRIMQVAYVVLALGLLRLLWSYRFSLFSHIFGKSPRAGAISLPYHAGYEAEALLSSTSRPRTPASASHSRHGSVASLYSRPGSPGGADSRDERSVSQTGFRLPGLPRLSFSGLSQPTSPLPIGGAPVEPGSGHNPALGPRGGMLFLPLWYPTSPLPSPSDAPPAYQRSASPLPGPSSSPFLDAPGSISPKAAQHGGIFRPHALHAPIPSNRYRDEESAVVLDDAEEEEETPVSGASTSWTTYLPWWAKSGGRELDAAVGIQAEGARARTPVPKASSDADALSLHSVKVNSRSSS